jgi:hypothetical protein
MFAWLCHDLREICDVAEMVVETFSQTYDYCNESFCKMKITDELYAELCNIIERASQNEPVEDWYDDGIILTSDYARAGVNEVMRVLGLEMEPIPAKHLQKVSKHLTETGQDPEMLAKINALLELRKKMEN